MRKRATVLAVIGCGLCLVGWKLQGTPPDLSSPKATVRSFVTALFAKDGEGVAACVQGAQAGPELKALLTSGFGPTARVIGFEIKDLIAETDADHAKVAAEVTLQVPTVDANSTKMSLSVVELFTLLKQDDKWRLVPDENVGKLITQPDSASARFDLRPIASMVALAAMPTAGLRDIQKTRDVAIATTCMSNEKQISLGILMYVQDYDEKFPRKSASYKQLIFPYVKNEEIFRCPLDAKGTISYTFNANLQAAKLADMVAPAQTVLIYEGKNMQIDFRHAGKAAVGFADGHVKMMTPEQAKDLFWYPAGKTPKPKASPTPPKRIPSRKTK